MQSQGSQILDAGAFLQWSKERQEAVILDTAPKHLPDILSQSRIPEGREWEQHGSPKAGWPCALGTGHLPIQAVKRRQWQQCELWHVPWDIMGRCATH